jgi:hypothetical protein
MADKKSNQSSEKNEPFVVVAANSFDSDTFVFPKPDETDVPNVTVIDFNLHTIRFATPQR